MKVVMKPASQILNGIEKFGEDLQLPVGEFSDSEEDSKLKALVPNVTDLGYVASKGFWCTALAAISAQTPMLITGHTGIGKSSGAMVLASMLNLPLHRIPFDGDLTRGELIGFPGVPNPSDPEDDGYRYGSLPRAIKEPGIVLLDEWDALSAEIAMLLHPVLEQYDPKIFIPEKGEVIPRHRNSYIVATANTKGTGDLVGVYKGTRQQNVAQINRFGVIIEMHPPDENVVRRILKKRNTPPSLIDKIAQFYSVGLELAENGNLVVPVSVRAIVQFADMYQKLGPYAMEVAIVSKANSVKEADALREVAIRCGIYAGEKEFIDTVVRDGFNANSTVKEEYKEEEALGDGDEESKDSSTEEESGEGSSPAMSTMSSSTMSSALRSSLDALTDDINDSYGKYFIFCVGEVDPTTKKDMSKFIDRNFSDITLAQAATIADEASFFPVVQTGSIYEANGYITHLKTNYPSVTFMYGTLPDTILIGSHPRLVTKNDYIQHIKGGGTSRNPAHETVKRSKKRRISLGISRALLATFCSDFSSRGIIPRKVMLKYNNIFNDIFGGSFDKAVAASKIDAPVGFWEDMRDRFVSAVKRLVNLIGTDTARDILFFDMTDEFYKMTNTQLTEFARQLTDILIKSISNYFFKKNGSLKYEDIEEKVAPEIAVGYSPHVIGSGRGRVGKLRFGLIARSEHLAPESASFVASKLCWGR